MTAVSRYPARHDAEPTLDLLGVFDMLWRARRLIALTTCVVLAMGVLYACFAKPTYESSMLVQIENNPDDAANQLLGSLSSFLGVKSTDDAEMQILSSRNVVGTAVDQTRYYILAEPRRFPLLGPLLARSSKQLYAPGVFGFGGFAWGNESIALERFDTPSDFYEDTFMLTVLDGGRYRLSSSDLSKDYEGKIGETAHIPTDAGDVVLHITHVDANPGTAFKLIRYSRQKTVTDLQSRISIIDKAKDAGVIAVSLRGEYWDRITQLVAAVGDAYVSQNSEQKSLQAQKSLTFLEQQLPGMKDDLRKAEDALLAYRNKHGAIDLSEQAKLELGQMVALQTRISLLQQERQAKLEPLMPDHPAVLAINSQVAELKRELGTVDASTKGLPDMEQDVVRLTREVRVNTDLYVAMLNSIQQLKLLRAGKVGNVRIVDAAEYPEDPIWPLPGWVVAGALLGGLMIGVCLALLRGLWRGAVTDPQDIEQALDIPVQAVIAHSKAQSRKGRSLWQRLRGTDGDQRPLATMAMQDPAMESLRSLAVAVQLSLEDASNNVVLITSATEGIGKSFVASNLAICLAHMGKRVLLIDGDLRKGRLHRAFQASESPGFTQVLHGQTTWRALLQTTDIHGLTLLSTGSKLSYTGALLQSESLQRCVAEAADQFDVIVMDTAPLLPVADTLQMSRLAGRCYLVARYNVTSEGELAEAQARLARVGTQADGVVLNDMQASLKGVRYGQYGYGNYAADIDDGDMGRA